jgi:hypothetical protein
LCKELSHDSQNWEAMTPDLKPFRKYFEQVDEPIDADDEEQIAPPPTPLTEVQKQIFFRFFGMLKGFVAKIGAQNFHGRIDGVWNTVVWFDKIIKMSYVDESLNVSGEDCWLLSARGGSRRHATATISNKCVIFGLIYYSRYLGAGVWRCLDSCAFCFGVFQRPMLTLLIYVETTSVFVQRIFGLSHDGITKAEKFASLFHQPLRVLTSHVVASKPTMDAICSTTILWSIWMRLRRMMS